MLTIQSAHSPIYACSEGNCISLMVKFAEFNEELPFGATPHDPMPYGVELFNRAKAGEFGEIEPFVDHTIATQPQPSTTGSQTL
jgi:hypothetical protein